MLFVQRVLSHFKEPFIFCIARPVSIKSKYSACAEMLVHAKFLPEVVTMEFAYEKWLPALGGGALVVDIYPYCTWLELVMPAYNLTILYILTIQLTRNAIFILQSFA